MPQSAEASDGSRVPGPSVRKHRARNVLLTALVAALALFVFGNHFIIVSSSRSFVVLWKTSWNLHEWAIAEATWRGLALHHPILMSRLVRGGGVWVSGSQASLSSSEPTARSGTSLRPVPLGEAVALSWGPTDLFFVWNTSSQPVTNIQLGVDPGGYAVKVRRIEAFGSYYGSKAFLANSNGQALTLSSTKPTTLILRVFSSPWPEQSGATESVIWKL